MTEWNEKKEAQAHTETPFDSPDDTVEIVCPNCNEEGFMVQHQLVWHRYPITYTNDGGDIDHNGGEPTKEWAGDGTQDCYMCLNCETEFTYDALLETDQAITLQEENDCEGKNERFHKSVYEGDDE